MVTAKMSRTDMCSLAPLQVQERVVTDAFYGFNRECIGEFWLGISFIPLNEKILKFFEWHSVQWAKF